MNVQKCMTADPKTCHVGARLDRAAQIMWDHDCGYVPVVDDASRLVGVITDRDICMAAFTQGRRLSDLPVESAMARAVDVCHASDTLEAAERKLRARQVRRLPVVDDEGRVLGVLSLSDLARSLASRGRSKGKSPSAGFLQTLAAICAPRTSVSARNETHVLRPAAPPQRVRAAATKAKKRSATGNAKRAGAASAKRSNAASTRAAARR